MSVSLATIALPRKSSSSTLAFVLQISEKWFHEKQTSLFCFVFIIYFVVAPSTIVVTAAPLNDKNQVKEERNINNYNIHESDINNHRLSNNIINETNQNYDAQHVKDNNNNVTDILLRILLESSKDGLSRDKRAVTQALCPIKQGKHGDDEIAQLTKNTCTQTLHQNMCEEDETIEVRRNEIRPLGESRSAAVYYGHDLCFSFFSRAKFSKTDGCMSMCMKKNRDYEVSLDVSGYTRTFWILKFTGDCYFCGYSQPIIVSASVFLVIVIVSATCCLCCRHDPSRQMASMHQQMQQQMQQMLNNRTPTVEEKNPPQEEDTQGEPQGDVTMDDDNLNNTRDTRSRASPTGTQPSPSIMSRSEAITPSAPPEESEMFNESKDWTDKEC